MARDEVFELIPTKAVAGSSPALGTTTEIASVLCRIGVVN